MAKKEKYQNKVHNPGRRELNGSWGRGAPPRPFLLHCLSQQTSLKNPDSFPFANRICLGVKGKGCRCGSRILFRRGCTRLLLYFNTNRPHSFFSFFFFLQNTSCSRKPQVISGVGVHTPYTLPLDSPLTPGL